MNSQGRRIALVVGNSNYGDGNEVSGEENAKAMSVLLEKLGFEVLPPVINASRSVMLSAVDEFSERIRGAAVALFFYSGHGVQLDGKNYLIPVDGGLSAGQAVLLDDVLLKLGRAPDEAVKLAFLDACRNDIRLAEGAPRGFVNPSEAPTATLQTFSASPGQFAESGLRGETSIYTKALLKFLPVPGLELGDLLIKVRADVLSYSDIGQEPFQAGAMPPDFFFQAPVFIQATPHGWPHKTPVVILNGEVVMAPGQVPTEPLRLDAGENHLVIMVSNGKTYHNGQVWGRTEGWSYKLDLVLPDKNGGRTVTFEGSEDVPFKDGPHHGQTFIVAKVTLFVDPVTAEVSVQQQEADLAHREAPIWAQDQEILFQAKLVDLQISPDDILGGVVNFSLAPLFRPLLAQFLKTGRILDSLIVDPEKTFVAVRGNKAFRRVAEHCMTQGWPDRLRDLRASFAAFFNDRHPRPFDVFAEGLDACVRANAAALGINLAPADLRVWVSLDDLSTEVPAVEEPIAATGASVADAQAAGTPAVFSDEGLMELAQGAIFHPRQDEALIDTRTIEQVVQGVPISAQVYTFLSIQPVDSMLRINARIVADLADLQNKIGPLIDTIPLPTDNCSHFGVDNIVARIWGKQIMVDGDSATLKLNGDVDVWTCVKNPIPCTRLVWDETNVFGAIIRTPRVETFDCNPPIKNRNLSQPFEATLPFRVDMVDSQSFALRLGNPSVDLGGTLGGVTEGILRIAGVDLNAKVKEALDRAINPDSLRQTLPAFLLPFNPVLRRAELLSNSGTLALALEVDATLDLQSLGELIQALLSREQAGV